RRHSRLGETDGLPHKPQIGSVHALREERTPFEKEQPRFHVTRHRGRAKEQTWLTTVDRPDPGFCIGAGTADTEEKMATVGKKLRRIVHELSLALIEMRDELARVRGPDPDLHFPQTIVPRCMREDDGVFTAPAAAAEHPGRIGNDLGRA